MSERGNESTADVRRVHSSKEGPASPISCLREVKLDKDQEKRSLGFTSRAFSMTLVNAVLQR